MEVRQVTYRSSDDDAHLSLLRLVYTGCGDGIARAFDGISGHLLCTYRGHESCIISIIVDEKDLYTASQDGTIKVWDAL